MKKIYTLLISLIVILCLGSGEVASGALSTGTKVYLCAIIQQDYDHDEWIAPSKNSLMLMDDVTVITHTSFNSDQLASYIKNANIFEIQTHGSATKLKAVTGSAASYLEKSDIDGWSGSPLINLKLAYLGACKTGEGGTSGANLVNAMFAKGARCVIGYKEQIQAKHNRILLEHFNYALGSGYTIQNALAYADAKLLAIEGDMDILMFQN